MASSDPGYDPSGQPRAGRRGRLCAEPEEGRAGACVPDRRGNGLTLVDTLFDTDGGRVLAAIRQIGRQVTDLKNIIATHAHRSHIGALATLKKLSGATIWAHEWEADIIAGERRAQGVTIWPRAPLRVYYIQLGLVLGVAPHVPCEVDRFPARGRRSGRSGDPHPRPLARPSRILLEGAVRPLRRRRAGDLARPQPRMGRPRPQHPAARRACTRWTTSAPTSSASVTASRRHGDQIDNLRKMIRSARVVRGRSRCRRGHSRCKLPRLAERGGGKKKKKGGGGGEKKKKEQQQRKMPS